MNTPRQEPHMLAEAWQRFEDGLAPCLADLEDVNFLIIKHSDANYFVQFVQQRGSGMRAEAASNAYIDPSALLTVAGS
jgi:hypothetical protein